MKPIAIAVLLSLIPSLVLAHPCNPPKPKETPKKIHYQPPVIEKKKSMAPLWIGLAVVGTAAIIMATNDRDRVIYAPCPCEPKEKCD